MINFHKKKNLYFKIVSNQSCFYVVYCHVNDMHACVFLLKKERYACMCMWMQCIGCEKFLTKLVIEFRKIIINSI